jgi:hypothetical protein
MMMVGFSPIATTIAKLYGCNDIIVELQAILYVVMYIPANFVVIQVLSKFGLRVCLISGASLVLAGAWLRQLIYLTNVFEYAFIGTTVAAFGQGFFINSASKLASAWFGEKELALSTALGGLALPIGCILGFAIPAAMIGDEDAMNIEEGRRKFRTYMIV